MKMKEPYNLDHLARRRLHDRAYRAQQKDQSEVCGALVLNGTRDLELWFMPNVAGRASSWEIDLPELSRLRREAKSQGKRVAGTFHSHPVGYATPGPRDRRTARVNSLMLVYDVCAGSAQLWRFVKIGKKKMCRPVPLVVDPTPRPRHRTTGSSVRGKPRR